MIKLFITCAFAAAAILALSLTGAIAATEWECGGISVTQEKVLSDTRRITIEGAISWDTAFVGGKHMPERRKGYVVMPRHTMTLRVDFEGNLYFNGKRCRLSCTGGRECE
jgi:hypothetical protein